MTVTFYEHSKKSSGVVTDEELLISWASSGF